MDNVDYFIKQRKLMIEFYDYWMENSPKEGRDTPTEEGVRQLRLAFSRHAGIPEEQLDLFEMWRLWGKVRKWNQEQRADARGRMF